jgi:hypothetical protein
MTQLLEIREEHRNIETLLRVIEHNWTSSTVPNGRIAKSSSSDRLIRGLSSTASCATTWDTAYFGGIEIMYT